MYVRGRNAFQACPYQFDTVDGGTRFRPARIIFLRYMLQRPVGANSRTIETTNGDRTDTQTHRQTDRQTFAN